MVGDDRDAAIGIRAGDAAGIVLTGNEAPSAVAGEPVGTVRRLVKEAHPFAWGPLHAPVVVDIAKQQIAALVPPHRALGRAHLTAKTVGEFFELLMRINRAL